MQILESPASTPPPHTQHRFYSDGRPRYVAQEGDNESRDSFDDGGYTTATQIPVTRGFTDPDQPKLLLAEDPVQPYTEKRPLHDEYSEWASIESGGTQLQQVFVPFSLVW